ncbi:unnamed protein product [Calicophoron daubneyi]|uniref:Acidic leucine-rich nuclear phosphoprotein 32 family member A n=1 Tax=Calicophoron daubneyi TaxID=300641 RepID=A0AAV2TEU0_CALDB
MTFMTLTQRVELELGKREPAEVRELNLDHSKSKKLEGLSDQYTGLEELSLVSVGLETLEGLPELPSLKAIELSNNNLSGGLEALLRCPKLEEINLSGNKIESVDVLSPLAKLSSLRHLDLFNCDVTKIENYRKKIFALLPNVKYLDGLDENNEEEPSGEEVANGEAENSNAHGDEAEDEDEDNDSDEEEEEEEYGIEVLQKSGDLEDDDEEDYAPDEDEEAELDEYDDIDEDEEDEVEDTGANLSAAGVTEPRRPGSKRHHDNAVEVGNGKADDEAPSAKHKVVDETSGNHVDNGSTVDQ